MQDASPRNGFSLIELLIVLVLVTILGGVAYPSYVNYVLSAHRQHAMSSLLQWQLAQEQWFAQHFSYAESTQVSAPDASDRYVFVVTLTGTNHYQLTATAIGTQRRDSGCLVISVNQYDERKPEGCWL